MSHDATVHIVDDDAAIRDSLHWLMESVGIGVKTYDSAQAFLRESDKAAAGCVLLDVRLRDMSGLELQRRLLEEGFRLPIIFITGHGEVAMAVQAMKNGAIDFVTKPFDDQKLLDAVQRVLSQAREVSENNAQRDLVRRRLTSLSSRERQVLDKVIEGKLNKTIASELNISNKTVEAHRARVMDKMQAHNLAELVRHIALIDQDH
jgi:two-component system, LuxR family, response regulator FixJ